MADTSPDWMDFNAWTDLAGQSERETLERQQEDARTKTQTAADLLRRASRDAGKAQATELGANAYASGATGAARTTLSSVGSYGDYLKAKLAAKNAVALMSNNGGGEYGAVRSAMNAAGGYSAGAVGELGQLGATEARYGSELDAGLASRNKYAATQRGLSQARDAEKAARATKDEALRKQMSAHWRGLVERGSGKLIDAGGINEAARRYLSLQQGANQDADFDPESMDGYQMRSLAYDTGQFGSTKDRFGRNSNELKWGNYGKGK